MKIKKLVQRRRAILKNICLRKERRFPLPGQEIVVQYEMYGEWYGQKVRGINTTIGIFYPNPKRVLKGCIPEWRYRSSYALFAREIPWEFVKWWKPTDWYKRKKKTVKIGKVMP